MIIKNPEIAENAMKSAKIKAVAQHMELNDHDAKSITHTADDYYTFANEEYMVLTEDEADDKVKEYIKETVWAFNPTFIADHSFIDQIVIEKLQEACESANEALLKLIKNFDDFVEDAVRCDGRGHFLAGYDHNENEQGDFYLYRTN